MGVLGCALLSPNECLGECIEKLKDNGAEVFYDLRHQTIYEMLAEMFNTRQAIDVITVQRSSRTNNLLEQIGGIAYLSQLQDSVPSAANLSYYLEIVREKFLLRKMIQTCTEVVGRVYDYEGEVDALMDEVERDVLRISESRAQGERGDDEGFGRQGHRARLRIFSAARECSRVWRRAIADLDRMTDGLHGSEMIVIAARPSMGKTSLAMNIVGARRPGVEIARARFSVWK